MSSIQLSVAPPPAIFIDSCCGPRMLSYLSAPRASCAPYSSRDFAVLLQLFVQRKHVKVSSSNFPFSFSTNREPRWRLVYDINMSVNVFRRLRSENDIIKSVGSVTPARTTRSPETGALRAQELSCRGWPLRDELVTSRLPLSLVQQGARRASNFG